VLVPGQLVTRTIVEYLGGLLHSHKRMEMRGIVHEGYVPCIRVLKADETAALQRLH
jgi:arginine decarboxylase